MAEQFGAEMLRDDEAIRFVNAGAWSAVEGRLRERALKTNDAIGLVPAAGGALLDFDSEFESTESGANTQKPLGQAQWEALVGCLV